MKEKKSFRWWLVLIGGLAGGELAGNFNFGLNGPTEYPNALVETAFISNPRDEKHLLDPHSQRRMARGARHQGFPESFPCNTTARLAE